MSATAEGAKCQDEPVCVVCECKEGEYDRKLTWLKTFGGFVPICQICSLVSVTHAITKCRGCGAIATIPWHRTPYAFSNHDSIIAFVEDCKFCKGG